LKDRHIDVIVSSDLLRARQTAEIISKEIGVPIIFEEKFRERNYGVLEGLHEPEWKVIAPTLRTDYNFRPENGENFDDLEHRIREAFFSHRERHANKVIALVAHRGTLRMIFKILRNWNPDQYLADLGAPNGMPFEMEVGEPCATCGSDLYEDPRALEEMMAQRKLEGALIDAAAKSSTPNHE
jgi:broad specificity phosphatase PhoE